MFLMNEDTKVFFGNQLNEIKSKFIDDVSLICFKTVDKKNSIRGATN